MNLTKQVNQTLRREYSIGTQLILFAFLSLGYFMMLLLVAVRLPIAVLPFECLLAIGFAFFTMKAVLKLKTLFSLTTWKKYWHVNNDSATWENETFKLSWIGTFVLLHLLYGISLPFESTMECLTELGMLGFASFGFSGILIYGFAVVFQLYNANKSKKRQKDNTLKTRPLQVNVPNVSHFEHEVHTLNRLLYQMSTYEIALDMEVEHQLATNVKRLENMLELRNKLQDSSAEVREQAKKNILTVLQYLTNTIEAIITAHEKHILTEIEKQAHCIQQKTSL